MPDLESLTAADLTAWRHGRFRVHAEGSGFEVEVIEVSEGSGGGLPRSPFSLMFRGGPSPLLPQRIYAALVIRICSWRTIMEFLSCTSTTANGFMKWASKPVWVFLPRVV